ncbi:O-acetyltransferase OatA [Tumidithrix helvetica PCC 7403]|uniref:acyltransferase family protein n=1 Tax=Tumidithrix helvetica TaxID=3457545 RepID=UPI003C838C19
MKSSSGKYFIALDHIRALAAFMVFSWHFIHNSVQDIPSFFALSVLDQGHTGVALFMTLSGYLFAKLIDGKKIHFIHFIWNRFLRLAPLLFFVIFITGIQKYLESNDKVWYVWLFSYVLEIFKGVIYPTLPNGGWSITTEFHFYLVLPILLWLSLKSRFSLLFVVLLMICVRFFLYKGLGEIQQLAYWTIIGRLDQFVLGIVAYRFRTIFSGRHLFAFCAIIAFMLFYWWFDLQGGFYSNPSYPSSSILWVFMPTIEGAFYALTITWYDNSFSHPTNRLSRFFATIGTYSYSIYLFHLFFVKEMVTFIDENILYISNIYLAVIFSFLCFILMMPLGYLSYRFIESPFLKFRTRYI